MLNTNSILEVSYSDETRHLTLSQGEAHFDVAHNPERPFEVYAGKGLVRAIGTAFTVYLRKVDVEVIVTEGTVEIDSAEPAVTAVTRADIDPNKTQLIADTVQLSGSRRAIRRFMIASFWLRLKWQ